ncbi:MAG: carbohydrate ABC transporter permease [Ruthenibacterium lactatiformans]
MATSLYYAFCNYNILKPARWVGLKNFVDIFQDPTFYKALGVTLKFAFISVPLKLVFALIVALILLKGTKLTPFTAPRIICPLSWLLGGRCHSVEAHVRGGRPCQQALGISSHGWAAPRPPCGSSFCWQSGSSVLPCSFSVRYETDPPELYEAARVDGAGGIYSFFRITLPLLTPTIFSTSSCSSSTALWCLPRADHHRRETHEFHVVLRFVHVPAVF